MRSKLKYDFEPYWEDEKDWLCTVEFLPRDAMAADVAETTQTERPPRGREEVPVQLSRLLDAHQVIIRQSRKLARLASELGDDGTNDLVVSEVLRTNQLQVWFLSEHLVDVPLVKAKSTSAGAA
jgi:starvation-inducible DNA-binding protein